MLTPSKENVITLIFVAILSFPYFLFLFVSAGWYKTIVVFYGLWQSAMLMIFIKREFEKFGDKAVDVWRLRKKKK